MHLFFELKLLLLVSYPGVASITKKTHTYTHKKASTLKNDNPKSNVSKMVK